MLYLDNSSMDFFFFLTRLGNDRVSIFLEEQVQWDGATVPYKTQSLNINLASWSSCVANVSSDALCCAGHKSCTTHLTE